jgi:hypothetical protein
MKNTLITFIKPFIPSKKYLACFLNKYKYVNFETINNYFIILLLFRSAITNIYL